MLIFECAAAKDIFEAGYCRPAVSQPDIGFHSFDLDKGFVFVIEYGDSCISTVSKVFVDDL